MQNPNITMHYLNLDFSTSAFNIPKVLFCSNIKCCIANTFHVTRLESKRSNILDLYAFLQQFNITRI